MKGLVKSIDSVAWELRGIKHVLSAIWGERFKDEKTDMMNPDAFADEYISVEECARRLGCSEQSIRNWIAIGNKSPERGWVEGIHYVNISPDLSRKGLVRIPWNSLVRSFQKNRKLTFQDHRPGTKPMYVSSHDKNTR
jgi:hypothetical protein